MKIPFEKYGVSLYRQGKACEGYTLITPYSLQNNVWLMDMRGNYVHRWVIPGPPRNHAVLLPNGHLLCAIAGPLPPESDMSYPRIGSWATSAGLIELDWESNEVWKYVDRYQSHTFYRMTNGNTMIPRITRVPDELASKLRRGLPGTEDRGMIWTDGFREVNPEGKIVWEWDMADHLDPEVHVLCPICYRGDYTHMNSCEVLPDGNVLTSFRNIDTICIVDKTTGKIKWQWGPGEISHQHTPTLLENGNILLFDNGAHRRNGQLLTYSRALEVNPFTNKIEWVYKGNPLQSFYSSLISGCQRLPNGNTLICEGIKGRVFEVTMDGEIVWEFVNPFYAPHGVPGETGASTWKRSYALFRAYRYTSDYPGLKGKDFYPKKLDWVNRLYRPKVLEN